MFYNYLKISKKCLEKNQVIILYGRSGSGKSSYAKYIKELDQNFIIFDELWSIKQLLRLYIFVLKNQKVVIASHKPELYFLFLKLFRIVTFFDLDTHPYKIEIELNNRGYTYSSKAVNLFFKNWKTSYVDLDIILEKSGNTNFDEALKTFMQRNIIKHHPDFINN